GCAALRQVLRPASAARWSRSWYGLHCPGGGAAILREAHGQAGPGADALVAAAAGREPEPVRACHGHRIELRVPARTVHGRAVHFSHRGDVDEDDGLALDAAVPQLDRILERRGGGGRRRLLEGLIAGTARYQEEQAEREKACASHSTPSVPFGTGRRPRRAVPLDTTPPVHPGPCSGSPRARSWPGAA